MTAPEALVKALRALAEGYPFKTAEDRFIIIDNPAFQEDDGSAPKLVIDVFDLPALSAAVTVTEERCREVLRDECEKSTFKYASLVLAYPENFGESHWCSVALSAMQRIASEAALKSPTPQTGREE